MWWCVLGRVMWLHSCPSQYAEMSNCRIVTTEATNCVTRQDLQSLFNWEIFRKYDQMSLLDVSLVFFNANCISKMLKTSFIDIWYHQLIGLGLYNCYEGWYGSVTCMVTVCKHRFENLDTPGPYVFSARQYLPIRAVSSSISLAAKQSSRVGL